MLRKALHPLQPAQFSHSVSSNSATPRTVALQAPLSVGFPRQECRSGLLFPSPGDLSDPGIKPVPPALADGFFTTEPAGTYEAENSCSVISLDWMIKKN